MRTIGLVALSLLIHAGCATARRPRNLDFEHGSLRDAFPKGWRGGVQGYEVRRDSVQPQSGRWSLRLRALGGSARFVAAQQALDGRRLVGMRLRLGGYIRTEGVATDHAGLWIRVERASGDRTPAFNDLGASAPRGTTPWQHYQTEVTVPQGARRVVFGALLAGAGTAWFDSLDVRILEGDGAPDTLASSTPAPPRPPALDPGRVPARAAADSAAWARADSAIEAFQLDWRDAWMNTQRTRPWERTDFRARPRGEAAHCHWTEMSMAVRKHIIKGSVRAHASCPTWFPEVEGKIEDERRALDNGLARPWRWTINQKRAGLRQLLDSLALQLPRDVLLAGQRVRFDLDAGALRDAWQAANSCPAADPHCMLLQGLVFYSAGHAPQADSTFLAAVRGMDPAERCEWGDVHVLLEPAERRAFAAMPCADRAEFEARLWWLADPLWSEPGNERRAEDFARKVQITLLGPRGDGRQRLEPRKGGEAVKETLLRYGWPAFTYWAGWQLDLNHGTWLTSQGADTAAPYVVREYTRDRLHTLPDSAALASPLTARPEDWQLNVPADEYDWWPVEHYARDRSALVQLPLGQSVVLRRRLATRFAWAVDLDPGLLGRKRGDSIRATLFDSRSPGNVRAAGSFGARIGSPLVVDALLPPGPALIGIELPGDTAHPAARTRFGVEVAGALSAAPRERALSQPLLFDPLGTGEGLLSADAAVARMYGSTVFERFVRLGVYWEGYGFAAHDTVAVEVRVARVEGRGVLARLGIGSDDHTHLSMKWRDESGSARALQVAEGAVPVQLRKVVLDVSGLSPGTYALVISMNGVQSPVRSFELR